MGVTPLVVGDADITAEIELFAIGAEAKVMGLGSTGGASSSAARRTLS